MQFLMAVGCNFLEVGGSFNWWRLVVYLCCHGVEFMIFVWLWVHAVNEKVYGPMWCDSISHSYVPNFTFTQYYLTLTAIQWLFSAFWVIPSVVYPRRSVGGL